MPQVTDVETDRVPQRIVSLVPSWTESLFALGAGERIIAVTDYCVEPRGEVEKKSRIGGTKNPRTTEILDLEPDLVIANVEENRRRDVEWLEAHGVRVFVTFARTVRAALEELRALGELVGAENIDTVITPIQEELVACARNEYKRRRIFVAIWKDPWMTANRDTFVSDMIELAGGENVFRERERRFPLAADLGTADPRELLGDHDTRYPRVSVREIVERQPEIILLPDEPFPFSQADAEQLREITDFDETRIELLDGKLLTWYGVRMGSSLKQLRKLINGY